MAGSRVGVLADDEDSDIVDGSGEGAQDGIARGQPGSTRSTLGSQELPECRERLALGFEDGDP